MIALDTNLLVFAHRSRVPEHRKAKQVLQRAVRHSGGWGLSLPSWSEFLAVVTHPASEGRPSTHEEALAFLRHLTGPGGAAVWLPVPGLGVRLSELAGALSVSGARIFDLQIGLIAKEAGAREIWTHDRQFVAPPGLRVRLPLLES